ncbi:hypothetical protein GCM10022198_14840 [Klugiella xanthotipulae]|uniref:Uncharacterized protein n=1 Tax=Klugiella xanthotipulae TaxID=244735 RepID=A0A543I6K9_9MICO|nr:hypothetical protein [Klugiella xanthotipulae]TQM66224.1 hypothetical protein FB466_1058 [Klugiella xanthotipulae]
MKNLFTPGRSLVTGGSIAGGPTTTVENRAHSCGRCHNPFTGGREDCPRNLSNPRRIGAPRPPQDDPLASAASTTRSPTPLAFLPSSDAAQQGDLND